MEDAPGRCTSPTAGLVFSMVWVRATRVVISAALLAVVSLSLRVDGQVVRPDPTAAASANQTDIASDNATVPGERIERMLARMSPELNPQLHSLNLSEYVIVVGQQPEVSLFGSEPDLGGGAPGFGPPTHLEMMATVAPSDIQAAAGADALGIATAALSMLAPRAIDALAGWFAGDDDPILSGPRYAGYTGNFLLGGDDADPSTRVSVVPFYRTEGQPVSLSATFTPQPVGSVIMTVDDQPFGVFERDVVAVPVPDELLQPDRQGDIHLLKLTRPAAATREAPVQIDLVVVVREPDVGEP